MKKAYLNTSIGKIEVFFQLQKRPYKKILTSKSAVLENDKFSYIISSEYSGIGRFSLINKLKTQIKKRYEAGYFPLREVKKTDYFDYNENLYSGLFSCYEVDLEKAYLNVAKNLDIIDSGLYDKLRNVTGVSRKMILGSLATKKMVIYYNEKNEKINQEIIKDDFFCKVWENIVFETDLVMKDLMTNFKNHFLFYWVDNIFFSKKIALDNYLKLPFHSKENELNILNKKHLFFILMSDGREFNLIKKK